MRYDHSKMLRFVAYGSGGVTQHEQRHVARIDFDLESVRRGGSGRFAACTCEWRGPERATLAMAADDAMVHESDGTMSLSEVPLSDEPAA